MADQYIPGYPSSLESLDTGKLNEYTGIGKYSTKDPFLQFICEPPFKKEPLGSKEPWVSPQSSRLPMLDEKVCVVYCSGGGDADENGIVGEFARSDGHRA
jgi:hypothetical protein